MKVSLLYVLLVTEETTAVKIVLAFNLCFSTIIFGDFKDGFRL